MTHRTIPIASTVLGMLVLGGIGGCSDSDTRLGELASQVTREQAEQNLRIAEGSKAVAQGGQHLVEADAQARRELIELQDALRQDQAEIGHRRDALESERKAIASQRRTESAISSGLIILGLILACLAPLVLAGISLLGLWREPTREEEGQVFVEELVQTLSDLSQPRSFPEMRPQSPRIPSAQAQDQP